MRKYSVKEVSKLSGVSVRTLHYYDEIGLLKPLERTDAGYRYYGEQELLRLQQILFYKELDFPLNQVIDVLDDPGFDLVKALENHKQALRQRKTRLAKLLLTIDNTINHLKQGGIMLKPEQLYEGLPKEIGTTYRNEAINKYGAAAVEQSENELMKSGKAGFEQLKKEAGEVANTLFGLRNEDPESEKVQQVISKHYTVIRRFWGTANLEDKQAEAYAGLGQLYVDDERFTMMEGKPQPEYAKFMQQAMKYFSDIQLR